MGVALDLIKQLDVVTFDWKHNNQSDIGLIAEEVEKVIPEAVIYNNEGQVEGLKPLTLIAVLVRAIQELKSEG